MFRGTGETRWRGALAVFALYASHVILDMACTQSPQNPGMTVLWPVSTGRWLFAWRPLPGIIHGGTGGGMSEFLGELLSTHNLGTMVVELAVFLPLLGLALYIRGVPDWVSGRWRHLFRRSA